MPLFNNVKELKCDNCNMTYDEFVNKGKFGCPKCYDTFSSKIDSILKRLHGSNRYIGKKALNSKNINVIKEEKLEERKENTELEKLQNDLKKAIAEERYEAAAVLRDKINNLKK